MQDTATEIVCCGHVCLDVIPVLHGDDLPAPGALAEVGPAVLSTGGSVSNTGLALHKLGVATRLVGCVGDDLFGHEIRRRYEASGAGLSGHLRTVNGEPTSYTLVISPPGGDRRFLHCPGVNAVFTDADVTDDALRGARHLHFGYPPAMRAMCSDDGAPLKRLFQRARAAGLTTSLDMCGIAPNGWAGKIDWRAFLANVLPHTDVFLPSADEMKAVVPAWSRDGGSELPCPVLVIKDGENGLSIRTSSAAGKFGETWADRSLRSTTFVVEVAGTTGAGDTTIAGFLAGMLRGASLEATADLACAAGAHCVQTADATSGLCSLDELHAFLARNPPRRTS